MKRFLLLAVLMLPLMSSCGEENPVLDIIPVPSSVRMGAGHFLVPANVEAACGDSSFFAAADFLKMNLDGCLCVITLCVEVFIINSRKMLDCGRINPIAEGLHHLKSFFTTIQKMNIKCTIL